MVLGVVAIGVMSYLALHRPAPPGFTAPAAAATNDSASPTSSGSASSTTPEASPTGTVQQAAKILVVGDDFVANTTQAGPGSKGWTELVGADLSTDQRGVAITVAAADGSGYLVPGRTGATFAQLAEKAGTHYDVVLFFGSRNDTALAPDLQRAARETFVAAATASPDARLVVIGPVWPEGNPPGYILTNRDTAAAAAAEVSAPFVDPLAARWLTGPGITEGADLTEVGQRRLADLVLPSLNEALKKS
jgi:hypothetical protein